MNIILIATIIVFLIYVEKRMNKFNDKEIINKEMVLQAKKKNGKVIVHIFIFMIILIPFTEQNSIYKIIQLFTYISVIDGLLNKIFSIIFTDKGFVFNELFLSWEELTCIEIYINKKPFFDFRWLDYRKGKIKIDLCNYEFYNYENLVSYLEEKKKQFGFYIKIIN